MYIKPYNLKNVKFRYILNGKCYESNPKEISDLIKIYNKDDVLFGPVWCKGVYFYLSEKNK